MKIVTLYSGSSGNCTLLYNKNTKILIDVGKSASATNKALAFLNIAPKDINAILITHEHIDHIKGLRVFNKNLNLPVFAKEKCLTFIQQNNFISGNCKMNNITSPFYINDICVNAFNTSHDSLDSCGFYFNDENGRKISIFTDLGEVTMDIIENVKNSDIVVIEANYDDNIIAMSSYPQFLKSRIKSKKGHLSNEECAKTINTLAQYGTKKFLLAHLSKENNMPILAVQTVKCLLQQNLFNDVIVNVADRNNITYI